MKFLNMILKIYIDLIHINLNLFFTTKLFLEHAFIPKINQLKKKKNIKNIKKKLFFQLKKKIDFYLFFKKMRL